MGELEASTTPIRMRRFYEHTSKELAISFKSVEEAQRLLLDERAQLLSESKSSRQRGGDPRSGAGAGARAVNAPTLTRTDQHETRRECD